ncbi:unnamed protein product [Gongylonema pulchrum]|uniref:Late endosomal/lysosomal adaptor and MAPK and MTOR activator 5 n=1 Tax=Gongylonema pulchrum TaxID=637853 RepID=A0A183D0D0_9BILA|nr:unnamed protein product [Gongylonema pulchrum]
MDQTIVGPGIDAEQQVDVAAAPTPTGTEMFDDNSPNENDKAACVTTVEVDVENSAYTILCHSDGLNASDKQCESVPCSPRVIAGRRGSGGGKSMVNADMSLPFICSFDKLCLATLDANGQCLDAQGHAIISRYNVDTVSRDLLPSSGICWALMQLACMTQCLV